MPATNEVSVKVNPKVSYGFISIAGIVLALGQYLTALGTATAGGEITNDTIGLIASATVTFLGVAAGRYKQSSDVIKGIGGERAANSAVEVGELRESNVLYLDGQQVANALVKALNTNALLANMQKPIPAPVEEPGKNEEPS